MLVSFNVKVWRPLTCNDGRHLDLNSREFVNTPGDLNIPTKQSTRLTEAWQAWSEVKIWRPLGCYGGRHTGLNPREFQFIIKLANKTVWSNASRFRCQSLTTSCLLGRHSETIPVASVIYAEACWDVLGCTRMHWISTRVSIVTHWSYLKLYRWSKYSYRFPLIN